MAYAALCPITNEPFDDLLDEGIAWSNPKNKAAKILRDPESTFEHLIESYFRMPLEVLQYRTGKGALSKGEVKGFTRFIDKFLKNVESGKFGSGFEMEMYVAESFGKRDPTIRKNLRDLILASFELKGRTVKHGEAWKSIIELVEAEATERGDWGKVEGALYKFKSIIGTTAREKASKLSEEIQFERDKIQAGDETADLRLQELVEQQQILIKSSELSIFEEVRKHIEVDFKKIIENKKAAGNKDLTILGSDIAKLKKEDGTDVSPNIKAALGGYVELMRDMHKTLTNGVNAKVDAIVEKAKGDRSETEIKDLRKKLIDRLSPNSEEGYYPHFMINLDAEFLTGLMPRLDSLEFATDPYVLEHPNTIQESINSINTYISKHAQGRKERSTELENLEYSPAFIDVVTNYINAVDRFNFIAFADKSHAKALRHVEQTYKDTDMGLEGYALGVYNYITDLNMAATGRRDIQQNPHMRNFLRTLLGFEFISKMGINPRGAARNFTQRLLDYIEWGPKIVKESKKWWSQPGGGDSESAKQFLEEMEGKGYFFAEGSGGAPELLESLGTANAFTQRYIMYDPATNEHVTVEPSKMRRAGKILDWVAGKSAFMHRKVENSNRKLSLQVGYYQMYKWLSHPRYAENLRNSGDARFINKEGTKSRETEVERNIESQKIRTARNYAERMMILNHFDYNDFSKARILSRPLGRVLGQFQHFSFEFFRRTMEIGKGAKDDWLVGDYNGANAWKAYRYSMIYFMAPVIASVLTGIEFENLVENDTARRFKDLATWLTGDDDEKKTAFYGRGPVMGNIGAPVLSDLLAIGQLMDIVNMDEDGLLALLTGYDDMSKISTDRATYEKVRLLNTAAARIIFRDLPQAMKGNPGWALVQSELGLYPTATARKKQEAVKEKLPPEIMKALKAIEAAGGAKL